MEVCARLLWRLSMQGSAMRVVLAYCAHVAGEIATSLR